MALGYIVIITMIVWRPTIKKHTQTDYANVTHSLLFFTNFENNKFGEARNYHNEPFKTPVAEKEIINLKDEMDNIITHKYRKTSLNQITRA